MAQSNKIYQALDVHSFGRLIIGSNIQHFYNYQNIFFYPIADKINQFKNALL